MKSLWVAWREDYVAELERRGRSVRTRRLCRVLLAVFERFCRRRRLPPQAFCGAHYQAFVAALPGWPGQRGRGLSRVTQHMVATAVLNFVRWAFDTGRLSEAQARGLPARRRRGPQIEPATAWSAWRTDFLNSLRSRGQSPATLSVRMTWLRKWEGWALTVGLSDPAAVTRQHMADFLFWLAEPKPHLGRPWAVQSQEQAIVTVRLFWRWAVRTDRLLVDPSTDCRLHHAVPMPRIVPTVSDMHAMLTPQPIETRCQARNRVVLELLYGTALRRSECAALDLLDVNLRHGWLRVRHGKGGNERLVPLGDHLVAVMDAYLHDVWPRFGAHPGQAALFLNQYGQRLGVTTIVKLVRQAGRRVGLLHLQPHDLRRACATHLLTGGARLEDVSRQLGHHGLSAVDHYVRLSPEDLQAEHARTHPLSDRAGTPS